MHTYYAISATIARVNDETCALEIKDHKTNQWTQNNSPQLWSRIQIEGEKVSKADAEIIYNIYHQKMIKE